MILSDSRAARRIIVLLASDKSLLVGPCLEIADLARLSRSTILMRRVCWVRNDRLLAQAYHIFEVVGLGGVRLVASLRAVED